MTQKPFRIDIHRHAQPPECLEVMKSAGIVQNANFGVGGRSPVSIAQAWETTSALRMMDSHGIAVSILSDYAAYSFGKTIQEQLALARKTNTFFAQVIAEVPHRFGAFACLPMPHVDAVLEEIDYALDTLHLDGVGLYSSYLGRYLGDPTFDPVLSELDRRQAVIFLHPSPPRGLEQLHLSIPLPVLEFAFDTTRALTNLCLHDAFERYPAIRFICAHAGGVTPYLQLRLTLGLMMKSPEKKWHEGKQAVAQALSHLYYDTALSTSSAAFCALQTVTTPSQLLFGSDCPPLPEHLLPLMLQEIESFAGFDEADISMIERENALGLFPRLHNL